MHIIPSTSKTEYTQCELYYEVSIKSTFVYNTDVYVYMFEKTPVTLIPSPMSSPSPAVIRIVY